MSPMRTWGVGVAGLLLGYALWVGSPRFTHVAQPWSAAKPIYLEILFVVGALLASIRPKTFWIAPLTLYVGQACALATQGYLISPTDPPVFYPIALLFLASYSFAAFFGAALGASAVLYFEG
jgi:hypothetical protein